MNITEVSQLSLKEKFQVMEAIWQDIQQRVESFEVPESHRTLLDHRRERHAVGDSKILNWEDVKTSIGKR